MQIIFIDKILCLKKLQFVQAISNQVLQVIKDLILLALLAIMALTSGVFVCELCP